MVTASTVSFLCILKKLKKIIIITYRLIIFNYISENINIFIKFFAKKDNENNNEYYRRFSIFINNILIKGVYPIDFKKYSSSSILTGIL